jgi:hypothetical protein
VTRRRGVALLALLALLALAIAAGIAACNGGGDDGRRLEPANVPRAWREVRDSAGHRVHVAEANVPCRDCHGDVPRGGGFAPAFTAPPADLCERCHPAIPTPLHPPDPIGMAQPPGCQDCHGFGADLSVRPASCMRCHDRSQGLHTAAVGAHADQPCGDCHRAHATPSLDARPCAACHEEHAATRHAGTRGCLDCHAMHEPELVADARCTRCHQQQRGRLRVTGAALHAGHPRCTGCHAPHAFGKQETVRCESCHTQKPVLAPAKHARCAGCHAPHATAPRPCTSCHAERAAHPAQPGKGPCAGCHPPHPHALAGGANAVACERCHDQPRHATAPCAGCHAPHGRKPVLAAAL